jgi:hypothetical protein
MCKVLGVLNVDISALEASGNQVASLTDQREAGPLTHNKTFHKN